MRGTLMGRPPQREQKACRRVHRPQQGNCRWELFREGGAGDADVKKPAETSASGARPSCTSQLSGVLSSLFPHHNHTHTYTRTYIHKHAHVPLARGSSFPSQVAGRKPCRTPFLEGDWRAVTLNETGSFDYYTGVGILSTILQLCFKN